ncbi:hypothetical protein KR093_007723 [Drosophila rubida]|uniref:BtpA family membrane complex biogenesis protein n=1 Tax=Drosophila rubida TaxID=30044 RepID=A0AAD4JWK5_9MUSC|nr:hypothetical protein KR093_007723 [Drosophila rubida]
MQRFKEIFGNNKCKIIGMIHVNALPGTPRYGYRAWESTIEKVRKEAQLYKEHQVDGVLIENMHDVPYVRDQKIGAETVACMTHLAQIVRGIIPAETPCGVQVLACGNKHALAVAKASDLQFIRAEGYVFGHIGDEGYTDSCAGELLRYRKKIDAEDVMVFTDLKKKHSSHAITADISLLETAKAAEFFLSDGVIVTGTATGQAASSDDMDALTGKVKVPLLVGSGVTKDNISDYFDKADAVIIGSHFKHNGNWLEDIDESAVEGFMRSVCKLRSGDEK